MSKPVSGTLQRWIMVIGVGTFISVGGGLVTIACGWQSFKDELKSVNKSIDRLEINVDKEFKEAKTDCKNNYQANKCEIEFIKKDVRMIENKVAAHTGKPSNWGKQ